MGFEDPACGEKRSATLVRKEMKKEEKKHIFTCMPANEAMAAVGVGAKGRMRRRRGGLRARGRGCVVIPLAYAMGVVPVQRRRVW